MEVQVKIHDMRFDVETDGESVDSIRMYGDAWDIRDIMREDLRVMVADAARVQYARMMRSFDTSYGVHPVFRDAVDSLRKVMK